MKMMHPTNEIVMIRHGETAWTLSHQHTSFTDLDLTENGKKQSEFLAQRIANRKFKKVFCSPLKRAKETCRIAGLLDEAEICDDLLEWNYGEYEGVKTIDIRKKRPDWLLFRDGAPKGETPEQVGERADRIIERAKNAGGDVVIFSSGHISRVIGARWIGLPSSGGKSLYLSTASLCILGWEREVPVIKTWNDTAHLHGA